MSIAFQVTIDCTDPGLLADFWADLLGYRLDSPPAGFDSWEVWLQHQKIPESEWNSASAIVDPDGVGPRIFFQRVPEAKQHKNRVHLDVNVSGKLDTPDDERQQRVELALERAVALGATKVRLVEEYHGRHYIMRDIEDNEFCLQ